MSRTHDVIIVGGGPSGSSLAWSLERHGLRPLVVDKADFPRDKTCAGWVTPAVLSALEVDLADFASHCVLQPIHSFRIGLMGQAAVHNHHGDSPVSYGILRREFDNYLLMRTHADKALGTKFRSLERDKEGLWCLNGEYHAPLVVGAGGHFCPIAARLGEGPGKNENAITAKEVEFEMNAEQAAACEVREDTPELWFCRDLKGYAWIFRKDDYLNIGLGRQGNYRLKEHLQAFVEDMQAQGRVPRDLPGRFKGHAYLLYGHAQRPLIGDGLMLIGDAAGLAYDQSGEGIRPGVESALLAAAVIARAADYSEAGLAEYAQRIDERFGARASAAKAPAITLPAWVKLKVAQPLMRSHWFTRHVVTERWFLHEQVPPLQVS